MEDAALLSEAANPVPGFDLNRYIDERHFNYSGDELRNIHLVLEFTNEQTAMNLREVPFTRNQIITELSSGGYRLEADLEDSILLDGWINTWREIAGITKVEKIPR